MQRKTSDYFTHPWVSDSHTWKCKHELRGEREQVVTVTLAVTRFAPGSADYDCDE